MITQSMELIDVYIGFFTFAGYDRLIVANTEARAWRMMKKEYYKWKKTYGYNPYFTTFNEARDWFGYRVVKMKVNSIIEH